MQKTEFPRTRRRDRVYGTVLLMMTVLLMLYAEGASMGVKNGLQLCVRTMIPSLFPFMALSELIVRSGFGERIAYFPARLLSPLLGLPREGVCAMLLGWLCGFPIGARTAADYYGAGKLTRREFHLALLYGNIPSVAFLVGTVGVALFGDANVGRWLLLFACAASLSVGLLFRLLLPRTAAWQSGYHRKGSEQKVYEAGAGMLPQSIAAAGNSMLSICATVVLFAALLGALQFPLSVCGVGEAGQAVIFGLFELSGGVCAAAALPSTAAAGILCAAMVGWGGLSVHCQILAVCREHPVSPGVFWSARAMQALLCAVGMGVVIACGGLRDCTRPARQQDVSAMLGGAIRGRMDGLVAQMWCVLCLGLFLFGMIYTWKRRKGERG